jgi:hypothetical protein
MTRPGHHRQALPNRRFRKLLPAAVAVAALASASVAGPAKAAPQQHPHGRPAPPSAAVAPVVTARRQATPQPNGAT